MSVEEYFQRMKKATNDGRQVEMALFGDTTLFHTVTCYVEDVTIRSAIRFDVAVYGLPIEKVAAKYGQWIDKSAPCMCW